MDDIGIKLSDQKHRNLLKRLEAIYDEAYKEAIKNNKKALEKYNKLTDKNLKGLSDEIKKKKRQAFWREVQRTNQLIDKIAAEIARSGETAAKIIQGELGGIYGLNYDYATFSIQRQAGIEIDFTLYDRNQFIALVQNKEAAFTKLAYKRLGQDKIIVQRLQNHLGVAILNGESQQEIIKRIREVTGQSFRQARRVAQTERNRVQSQGRNMGIEEANRIGVETEKEWIARLRNTRESHMDLHMKVVAGDEPFQSILGEIRFPGDPTAKAANSIGCFCYIKPVVKSVSPALAKNRAWAKEKNFERYQAELERKRVAK